VKACCLPAKPPTAINEFSLSTLAANRDLNPQMLEKPFVSEHRAQIICAYILIKRTTLCAMASQRNPGTILGKFQSGAPR